MRSNGRTVVPARTYLSVAAQPASTWLEIGQFQHLVGRAQMVERRPIG